MHQHVTIGYSSMLIEIMIPKESTLYATTFAVTTSTCMCITSAYFSVAYVRCVPDYSVQIRQEIQYTHYSKFHS